MSIQQVVRPVITAMRLANALRQLRDLELADARRYFELRERAGQARAFLDRRLRAAVDHARECNHRLVHVQRKLRQSIEGGAVDTLRQAVRL